MKILADENAEAPLVTWLRDLGHDVAWIAELSPRERDPTILRASFEQDRVLLTNDLDFGELVFLRRQPAYGVILLRIEAPTVEALLGSFQFHWPLIESRARGNFIVVENDAVRIRPLK